MMKRAVFTLFVVIAIGGQSTESLAFDKDQSFSGHGVLSCGRYIDAYSRSELTDRSTFKGTHEAWNAFGWINGFITAYNSKVDNGKFDILGSMSMNDARRWLAAWCRDNPSKDSIVGLIELIHKLEAP